MGGTSFDVSVVRGGEPALSAEKDIAYGVPIRVPMVDIHTIGAGGGSIALHRCGRNPAGRARKRGSHARTRLLRPRRRPAHGH